MLRYIYNFCFYLLLPFIVLRLLIKSRRNPDYRRRCLERFGWFKAPALKGGIWLHTVSVGETIAAVPLIKQLQQQYPDKPLIITTMTPTGSERVRTLFDKQVFHVYIPYDFPGAVQRFLTKIQPELLILMETELWPNCLHYCAQQHIPILLANARLSERSCKKYNYIKRSAQTMLQYISCIAAQAEPDAKRFIQLGAEPSHVTVTGSMKFDINLPIDIRQQALLFRKSLGKTRPVWIAASTHEGEEELVLLAFKKIRESLPRALLILVPRHLERFTKVATLCEKQGFHVIKRSQQQPCLADTDIYIGDTMGELLLLYAASDVAYIGGSLVAVGGHNILEPAALGIPAIIGPHYFNFTSIVNLLTIARVLKIISDADQLATTVIAWLNNSTLRQQVGRNAQNLVATHRGAVRAHMEKIGALLQ